MAFPNIANIDFSEKGRKNQQVHDMLDYAVAQYNSRSERRKKLEKLYNSFNGIIDQAEIDSIIKTTGKKSKTRYIKYRLGRSKIKQLHGEFLQIPITAQVHTTGRDSQNEKMNKYKNLLGMSLAKPYIEKAREMGYDVFNGINIPDKNDKTVWNVNNFKLANEIAMSTIIEDVLKNKKLKSVFYNNWVDLTITSEIFGKLERDINGRDTYRYVQPKNALYEETVFDPFLERTPYMGEVRLMYYHEILESHEFDLSADQKENLKELKNSYASEHINGPIEKINGQYAIPVYTIQWKGLETVYEKISKASNSNVPYKRILSEEYYKKNKSKIERDVKANKYELNKYYREKLWTASRISKNIYTAAKEEKNLIQILNDNGIYNVDFDYTGLLFSTVDGYRVSLQEIIYELERIYDDIRFMINKEIRKIRGDTLIYDDAYLPKGKRFIDVLHSVSEDGVVRYNSSGEGNLSQSDSDSNKVGIGSLNLGQSQVLVVLLNQAMDIERVMDRITGMNESRQGLGKASATATTNNNNIEASRSMTYDVFFFMKEYIERVLLKLAEKIKLNKTYLGQDSRQFVLSDEEIQYLISTKNLIFSNYAVTITDGQKEKEVLEKIEQMFPQEINAGMLRSKDVATFLMEDSFSKAIKVLDKAHSELAAMREKELRVQQEAKNKEIETNLQIANEDREDRQDHEKDMEVLRTEGKKEIVQLEGAIKATQDFQNNIAKGSIEKQKQTSGNPFD